VAQRKTLTEARLGVLRSIGADCPEGVMAEGDDAHRVSASALARRGLVETSGRGPSWSAAITERPEKKVAACVGAPVSPGEPEASDTCQPASYSAPERSRATCAEPPHG